VDQITSAKPKQPTRAIRETTTPRIKGLDQALFGHNVTMLATLVGSLATIGTVTFLAWDWWHHPTL
jgi:hypothetical protein